MTASQKVEVLSAIMDESSSLDSIGVSVDAIAQVLARRLMMDDHNDGIQRAASLWAAQGIIDEIIIPIIIPALRIALTKEDSK
jgi:hypothetical protein